MTKKADGDLWPMVMVPKKEWDALVRFFRRQEIIIRGSLSVPGQEKSWMEEYKKDDPGEFRIYEPARRAASRKFGKLK